VVSNNQNKNCGLLAKPQVTPHKVTPKNCGQLVGGLFKARFKPRYKQQYPQLSTPYPHLGGMGLGRTFQYLVVLNPYFLDCCFIRLVNSVTWL
jgi:hypothetical protein